ncbi:hypothetical protein JX265_006895 [Neoarthrinium moseri]|uniref:FHA domain-containing protein n=1 Tax=Neoarthrinium moseri TaxID=1658444 RepID=A0A9P9WLH9_9PEZI|nr:hypothetical protein JX266_011553 [Neoarthrinium moseri]KAI1868916.1 hypothetical protein JX265_006895 [Neoarthrinium moseri]
MSSSPGYTGTGRDVTVTLTACHPGPTFVEPNRKFTLTEQNPVVRVGRASKVATKGFIAAGDNAWFESPTLHIKDTGSLHGTFRRARYDDREDRLPVRDQVQLRDGDNLRFGIDIYRSHETFPPCVLALSMSWNEPTPTSTHVGPSRAASTNRFVVPDDDEDEDEDESEDLLITNDPFSELNQSRSAQMDREEARPAIDLTRETPPPPASRLSVHLASSVTVGRLNANANVIDLTSEAPYDSSDAESMNYDIRGYSPSEDGSESDLGTSDDYPSSPAQSDRPGTYSLAYDSDGLQDIEDEIDVDIELQGNCEPTPQLGSHGFDSGVERETSVPSDYSDASLSEYGENEAAQTEVADMDDFDEPEEDDMNNVPYFEEDLTSLSDEEDLDATIFEKDTSPIVDLPASSPPVDTASRVTPYLFSSPKANAASSSGLVEEDNSFLPFPPKLPDMYSVASVLPAAYGVRLPSPSDAAMAKSRPIAPKATTSTSAAQAMGERTGKYEFFAARDQNRATVLNNPLIRQPAASAGGVDSLYKDGRSHNTQKAPIPEKSNTHPGLLWPEHSSRMEDGVEKGSTSVHDTRSPLLVKSAWTQPGEAFLQEPQNFIVSGVEDRTRLQSPELDMTSAATFIESKKNPDFRHSPSTRGLPIQALLAHESQEPSPAPDTIAQAPPITDVSPCAKLVDGRRPKRSFDEVFAAEEAECREPGSSLQAPLGRKDSPSKATTSDLADTNNRSDHEHEPESQTDTSADMTLRARNSATDATFTTLKLNDRPVKRRRFAQVAACALGTVMGGAAVLAGMIATAPNLS